MSKLIVEMEMPKLCCECPLLVMGVCAIEAEIVSAKFKERKPQDVPFCPIKGVLPDEHGDLIDRTLLYADLVGVILSHSGLNFSEVIARQNAVIQGNFSAMLAERI